MTSPRPGPHPGDHAGAADQVDIAPAPQLIVEDHRARRIRRPIDLLRCLLAILGIFVVAGIGLLARNTASGIEIDAVDASLRLPHPVLALLGIAADFALLLWPAALAIRPSRPSLLGKSDIDPSLGRRRPAWER